MGFLDKVKATAKDLGNAAKDVKGEIEKTGLLDSLKQQSQQVASDTAYSDDSSSNQYENEEPWDIGALIKERTGVDPGAVISTEEVRRLTGIDVEQQPGVGGAENFTGVSWRGQFKKDHYSFDVAILHDYIGDRTDDLGLTVDGGRTRMEETRGYFEDAVDVPGVGDEAFFDGSDYLYARRGRWTIMVTASAPESYDVKAARRNLAIQALNNLPA